MNDFGDDLGKQFRDFTAKTRKVLAKLPLLVANEGRNFFLDRFRAQNWIDYRTEPWKPRKPSAPRNRGRAILTDTGRGKRSIRILRAQWGAIEVGISDPAVQKYMAVHNNGFRGTVHVGEHSRIASRKVGTVPLKLRGRQTRERIGGRKRKIMGMGHQVQAHDRRVNIPRRRFIGQSHYLNLRINRLIISQLAKI